MKRVKNVRDTIYLLIFCKPSYAFELSKILYGRENKAVFAEIKQLVNDNCIEESPSSFVEKDEKGDMRSGQRKYYNARIDPIIEHIEKISNTPLDLNDRYPLRSIIGSRPFRYLVEKSMPDDFKEIPINAMDFILTYLDVLFIISKKTPFFKNFQPGPRYVKDYEIALESLEKNKIFIDKTPALLEILYKKSNDYNEEKIPKPVKDNFHNLFVIPRRLFGFTPFSDFGRGYYGIESLSQQISKLLES